MTQGGSSERERKTERGGEREEGKNGDKKGRVKRVREKYEAAESMTYVQCKVAGASTFAQHMVICHAHFVLCR